jgi:hypothetical protein
MKSSSHSDEIFGVPPQAKSNPPSITPRKRDFIAWQFHPRNGFIPTKADLSEKPHPARMRLFLVEII